MPKENLVSATLTPTDMQAILNEFAALRAKLPFLIELSAQERRRLTKMGDGSRAFVEKALIVAQANPQVLPPAFDVEEYARDWALYAQFSVIANHVTQLAELVDNTQMALGSDLMQAALTAYGHLNQASVGGLDEVRGALGQRFDRRRTATPAEDAAPTAKTT